MKMNKKLIVATAACAALLIGSISTSLAWLLDTTNTVENKFISSTLGVTLTETGTTNNVKEYDMVPGWTYDKNPKVTVAANSEPCYVFLKVEKSNDLDDFLAYTFDNTTWNKVPGVANVYYTEYTTSTSDMIYNILLAGKYESESTGVTIDYAADKVVVKPEVTKDMMDDLKEAGDELTFKFTAAAVQYYKTNGEAFGVTEAYKLVQWPTT